MNVVSDTSDDHPFEPVAIKESVKQITEVEVKFASTSHISESKHHENIQQYQPSFVSQIPQMLPILFLISWAIAVLFFLRFAPTYQKRKEYKVREQIPCKNCRFFTNNPYLRCAVRPNTALTHQAIDCSDYQLFSNE
jgi:hypothetical protein